MANLLARQNFEAGNQRFGLLAAVALDDADDDVLAGLLRLAGRRQHGVGLAHAGGGAEEDLQLATGGTRLFILEA